MALLMTIAIRFLETIFAIGAIGSVFVLILTTIEDIQELFGKEKTNHATGDYFPAGSKR
jgi:hypothetical protein